MGLITVFIDLAMSYNYTAKPQIVFVVWIFGKYIDVSHGSI